MRKLQSGLDAVSKQLNIKRAIKRLKDNPLRIVTANTAQPGEWASLMSKLSAHFQAEKEGECS